MVLFTALYKVVLSFESVSEILKCENYSAVLNEILNEILNCNY